MHCNQQKRWWQESNFEKCMQGKEEAAGKKRKQAAMDSCTLPHKINKWHLLPFIINHLKGNKWIFITINYQGQLVDANRFCADLRTSLHRLYSSRAGKYLKEIRWQQIALCNTNNSNTDSKNAKTYYIVIIMNNKYR